MEQYKKMVVSYTGKKNRPFILRVDLEWFLRSTRLSRRAAEVGVALWYLRGIKESETFVVSRHTRDLFGFSREKTRLALHELEQAKLITVVRFQWKAPQVTILLPELTLVKPKSKELPKSPQNINQSEHTDSRQDNLTES